MREEEGGRRDHDLLGADPFDAEPFENDLETDTVTEPAGAGWRDEKRRGGYRDLVVWQKAMAWVEQVYRIVQDFPAGERYELSAQLRRSAVSVPSNIAEGWGRGSKAEYRQFLRYARGSLFEAQTQIELASRLGFVTETAATQALGDSDEISRMLLGLARSQQ